MQIAVAFAKGKVARLSSEPFGWGRQGRTGSAPGRDIFLLELRDPISDCCLDQERDVNMESTDAPSMLKLTHFKLCPKSRAIRIALNELGLNVDLVEESPWSPSPRLLSINPGAGLPVLHMMDGSSLIGSYAIAEFLDEARGNPRMWSRLIGANQSETARVASVYMIPGDNAEDRAEVRRLISWFHDKFDREVTQELLIEKVRPTVERKPAGPPSPEFLRAAQSNLRYHLSYIGFLADRRRWLAGEELSYADISAAAHLSIADYLGEIAWERAANARDWYQRIKSRKSMRAILSDRIPGLTPPHHYAILDF